MTPATSTTPAHTEVTVEVPDCAEVLYVGFGEDSRVEIFVDPKDWRDRRFESWSAELETLATAVATGGFEETTWRRHGLIVKSVGVFALGDGPFRVDGRHTLMPLWGRRRVRRRYRGYDQAPAQ